MRAVRTTSILAAATLLAVSDAAFAVELPGVLPVQGRLVDAAGTPITAGMLTFTLLDENDDLLYSDSPAVEFDDGGFFTAYLGELGDLDLTLFRDHVIVHIEVSVEGDSTPLGPFEMGQVPHAGYAYLAGDAETLGGLAPEEFLLAAEYGVDTDQGAVLLDTATNEFSLSQTVIEDWALGVCMPAVTLGDGLLLDELTNTIDVDLTGVLDDYSYNVGIGTTGTTKLAVAAGTDTWAASFWGASGSDQVRLGTYGGVATIGANDTTGASWKNLAINPGGGNVGIGTTSPGAKLDILNGNLFVRNESGSHARIRLDTRNGGNNGYWELWRQTANGSFFLWDGTNYAMTVEPDGDVGIGTTAPAEKLDVNGNIHVPSTAYIDLDTDATTGNSARLSFDYARYIGLEGWDFVSSAYHGQSFVWKDDEKERMRLTNDGKLGIATAVPDSVLHVSGDNANNDLNATGYPVENTSPDNYGVLMLGKKNDLNISFDVNEIMARNNGAPSPLHMQTHGGDFHLHSNNGDAAKIFSVLDSGAVGIGTATPGFKLDVNGSVRGGGRVSVETERTIGGVAGNTVAVGYFSNDTIGKNIRVHLKAHHNYVIDVHTYEINEVAYIGDGTNWLEIPVNQNSVSHDGRAAYTLDVYRPNIASLSDPLYMRIRNKAGVGGGPVQLVLEYDDDVTFTELASSSTVATTYDGTTAPAGGLVTGYYGNLEWNFPVTNGKGWRSSQGGLFVQNSGKVGIGTTSPAGDLHLASSGWYDASAGVDTASFPVTGTGGIVLDEAYTTGSWRTRLVKIDRVGGIPLYIQETHNTANEYINVARFGIHSQSPNAFEVYGSTANTTGAWAMLSDRRLKRDIEPLTGALDTLEQLRPVTFRWKDAEKDAKYGRVRGFIAQDVEEVVPEWVKDTGNGTKQLETIGIDAVFVEAFQEQQDEIRSLRTENASQTSEIATLRSENTALRDRLDAIDQRLASLDRRPASPWASSMGLGGPFAIPALVLLVAGLVGERLFSARRRG